MDCRTARLFLDFQRPRAPELPPDDAAELARHLAVCPECDATAQSERRLDDHVGRAVRDVPLPEQGHERLLGRLKEERAAVVRGRVAWAARGLAVAAALLVVVWTWWHFIGSQPPKLDYFALRNADFEMSNARNGPEGVENWFQSHRQVMMTAPRQFDYSYLVDCDLTRVQGRVVPKLVFQRVEENGRTRALVFALAGGQFDLSDLRAQLANTPAEPNKLPEIVSLDRRLTLLDSDETLGTAYLVIYEGDKLDRLRLPEVGH
jgi:hypothetical protein